MGILCLCVTFIFGQAQVQIIHNSPTPGTDTGPAVDIYVNGALLSPLTNVTFRTATPYLDVDAGVDIQVAVAVNPSTDVNDAIATFDLGQLTDGQAYTIIAAGIVGNMNTPFDLFVNGSSQTTAANTTEVDVLAFHGAPGAPNVDVAARRVAPLLSDLEFGEYNGYLNLAPGTYLLDVRATGATPIVGSFLADLGTLAGSSATLFASGLLNDTPGFGLFAALADGTVVTFPATQQAGLQIIHNSPSPTVDIYVNGNLLLDNFEYLTATASDFVPAGVDLNIQVAPETSMSADEAIFSATVNLANGENYVAIAHGLVGDDDNPFDIALSGGARLTASDQSVVEILGFHGIPGAPSVNILDILADDTAVTDLSFGNFTNGYVAIDAQQTALEMRTNDGDNLVGSFFAGLRGAEGISGVLMAGGLLDADPLFNLFLVLPNGGIAPLTPVAEAQIIHNSPASAAAVVDLYSAVEPMSTDDYAILENDLAFRNATAYSYYPTRTPISIAVAPGSSTGTDDILFELPAVTFNDGKAYCIVATGIPGDMTTPFQLVASDQASFLSSSEDKVGLLVYHGSTDAPNVDISTRSNGATPYQNLAYGTFADYLEVDNAAEFLEVRAANNPNLVATFNAFALSQLGGFGANVFASGFLSGDDPVFSIFAALPNGAVVELSPFGRTQIIHNSPSPTVDIYLDGEVAIEGLEFRQATPMLDLPTRTPLDIAVVPAGGDLSAAVATVDDLVLNDGEVNIIMANGIVGDTDTPFEVVLNRSGQDRAKNIDEVDLTLFHGSPDAPEVDVKVTDGPVLFDNIMYGEFSEYINVAPGMYSLDVTPAEDNDQAVRVYDADLSGLTGGAAVVFASGFLAEDIAPEFGAWVALPTGQTFPLAEIVKNNELNDLLSVYSSFPNPTKQFTTVNFTLENTTQVSLSLVDLSGKIITTTNLGQLTVGSYREQLDFGKPAAGLYQLRLDTPQGSASLPIVITD